MIIESLWVLHGLIIIPVIIFLFVIENRKKKVALRSFAEPHLLTRLTEIPGKREVFTKGLFFVLGLLCVIVGLAGPKWGSHYQDVLRKGVDIIFMLDVSKSMLAEDLVPSRLERAKLAIRDCIDKLEGDRVGIVVFAGTAAVKCPLTLDYGFFRMMLDSISTDSIARGGTMIGDAVRKVLNDAFDDQDKAFKDIILITDGEDHDSFPVEAAKKAGEKGVRIIAIGLGDENEGKRIPITNKNGQKTFLKYKGQEIWTKLDGDTLREMANATRGGKYLNVATGTIDLGTVYTTLIRSAEKKKLESETIKRYEEKFQIFLAVALILILIEMIINDRKTGTN